MFLSLLKTLLFAGAILLVGQIPLGTNTLGSRFYGEVTKACRWTGTQVERAAQMAGFTRFAPLSRWVGKKQASLSPNVKREESDGDAADADGLSPSDKEALMRLLQ